MSTYETEARRPQPVYRLEGQMTDMVMIGPVPDGVRMNGHFSGQITLGEIAGATFSLVDYYRLRSDGTGIVNAKEVLEFNGHRISVDVQGYVHAPEGLTLPTVEEMLTPGFAYPDVPFTIQAAATFQTAAPGLEHLNTLLVAHTGTVNFATGALVVEAWDVNALVGDRSLVRA